MGRSASNTAYGVLNFPALISGMIFFNCSSLNASFAVAA